MKLQRILLFAIFLLIIAYAPARANTPTGAVYTVNSTDDGLDGLCNSAHCSLREAILIANANPGSDTIRFDFSTATTIAPLTFLPNIEDGVTIDGITGTGSTCPTATDPASLNVTLSGRNLADSVDGLRAFADDVTIQGLNIIEFDNGIWVSGEGALIVCNQIGTRNNDSDTIGNNEGIFVTGDDVVIGGSAESDRNVISGNLENGIYISSDSERITVAGNYIGTRRNGLTALPNGLHAIENQGSDVTIGGSSSAEGNVIVGDDDDFGSAPVILIDQPLWDSSQTVLDVVIQNNKIGVNVTSLSTLAHSGSGIKIDGTAQFVTKVVGDILIADNIIANGALPRHRPCENGA